jgi:hypothetical protein
VLQEILAERVVSSRNRRNPHRVKRKMSKFPLRPAGARVTPLIDFEKAIRIVK